MNISRHESSGEEPLARLPITSVNKMAPHLASPKPHSGPAHRNACEMTRGLERGLFPECCVCFSMDASSSAPGNVGYPHPHCAGI